MELAGVAERLRNKAVLITGATGFIAKRRPTPFPISSLSLFNFFVDAFLDGLKVLVEKILRLQPEVRRLFLLVRAGDQISAERRVQSEVSVFVALCESAITLRRVSNL